MIIPKELIKSFVSSEFPNYKTTDTGEYHFNSPFETKDKKMRCYINSNDGRWTDFKAGISGSFLGFVEQYLGLNSYKEAIDYLVSNYSFKIDKKEIKENIISSDDVISKFLREDKPIFFNKPNELGMFGKKAYKYVLNRNIESDYIPKLGYVFNDKSRYDQRIIIPFFENGQMVYFISRSLDPNNMLRYLNVEKLDSKNYVFNIDNINEEVIICEGTFDAMSITTDQAATCLLSADLGIKQMEKIFTKKPNTIIYVPDHDETGRKKMDSNINKLITYCPYENLNIKIFNVPDDCKDLNDMKIKYGKNYILKKECEDYKKDLFSKSLFK